MAFIHDVGYNASTVLLVKELRYCRKRKWRRHQAYHIDSISCIYVLSNYKKESNNTTSQYHLGVSLNYSQYHCSRETSLIMSQM